MTNATPTFEWSRLHGAGIGNADQLHEGDEITITAYSNGATGTARVARIGADGVVLEPVGIEADGS